ncbi:hypothetical protein HK102_009853 [Quaeritorhiza haematococci]|nr:hypothetical protein HK102_009853 [Quaeritorhiza haematococci]
MIEYHLRIHPDFKRLQPSDLRLVNWHMANLEFANAAQLKRLSLHHWDQDDEFEFGGYHAMVRGGYGQLPQAMTYGVRPEHTPLDIRFDKAVAEIKIEKAGGDSKSDAGMIKVTCRDETVFQCDAVVVTIPLGVLKTQSIKFDPPLPRWKSDAISRLGFGWFNKVVLVFPKRFWDPRVDSFGSLAEPPSSQSGNSVNAGLYSPSAYAANRGKFFLFWNLYPTTGLPVLVSFISGDAAVEMERDTDQNIVSQAMAVLSRIFPDKRPLPRPVETIITRWSRDEFSRGSYSYVANGATGNDYDTLAKTMSNKIFWAGEATCRQYPATVHGAMLSGMRTATAIADALLGPVTSTNSPSLNSELKTTTRSSTSTRTTASPTETMCYRPGCPCPAARPDISIFDHIANLHPTPVDNAAEELTNGNTSSPTSSPSKKRTAPYSPATRSDFDPDPENGVDVKPFVGRSSPLKSKQTATAMSLYGNGLKHQAPSLPEKKDRNAMLVDGVVNAKNEGGSDHTQMTKRIKSDGSPVKTR